MRSIISLPTLYVLFVCLCFMIFNDQFKRDENLELSKEEVQEVIDDMKEALEVVEEEESCKLTSPRKIREKQPKYSLNREKFLSAFVARGPNNQIYSLRETIYLAIALNRTLILPPFFKHDRGDPTSNGSNTAIVDFEQRIDIQKLTKLIPVIFTSEAAEKCPEGFDNIFGVHNVCHSKENPPRMAVTQEKMRLPINFDTAGLCKDHSQLSKIVPNPIELREEYGELNERDKLKMFRLNDPEKAREILSPGEEAKCAVTGFFYEMVELMKLVKNEDEKGELARQIIRYTVRPKHIRNLIEKFVTKYSVEKEEPYYMAIHWRYDEKDWKDEQCRRRPDFKICKDFELMRDPERLSDELENYLSNRDEKFDFIYIAAPPSELTVIDGVAKSFARKGLIPIVTQVQMSELMEEEFKDSCGEKFEDLRFEVLSMLDSEICTVAPVFYYSIMSSYSMNIQQERFVRTDPTDASTRFNGNLFGDGRYAVVH